MTTWLLSQKPSPRQATGAAFCFLCTLLDSPLQYLGLGTDHDGLIICRLHTAHVLASLSVCGHLLYTDIYCNRFESRFP